MEKKFEKFDRSLLKVEPLKKRCHNLDLKNILELKKVTPSNPVFLKIASKIKSSIETNSSVVLMMGAHVIRGGVQKYLIDMMKKGHISCIATNGASVIHDFEFALIGATTESVAEYIKDGKFGLWKETGRINDIVKDASDKDMGLGEAIGKVIYEEEFPYHEISIFAAAYQMRIPITVHVGIGYDIVHELPNCDGGAYGKTSYIDFLRFAQVLKSLENGVIMNFGSAVMAPEVYLKALSMARNVAKQDGKNISNFTTLVCDLHMLPKNYNIEPCMENPFYYFRPWKTMLVRTIAGLGESFYIQGKHSETIPSLWTALNQEETL
ncbi:MAG: deoxyhypusine synthase family protein [Desulfobacterales bacterium]|nr:deoxyhypusine synthase family protein [Desulfobacterales bacterium]MBF0395843.1 deoxyhypusine synthase family protein [Desulfobacterales bacterium]